MIPLVNEFDFLEDKKGGGQNPFFLIAGPCVIENDQLLEEGNLSIFSLKREVKINAISIDLTKTEFDFLECFIINFENVLSRDQLLEYTKYDYLDSDDRVVDVHIKNLRKKLEDNYSEIKIITVRGMGYRASK